jgi:hypothetical protein
MRIGKTWRQLLQVALAAGFTLSISIVVSRPLEPLLPVVTWAVAVPTYFIIWFGLSLVVPEVDHWLRRLTRDPLWLETDEGRRWKERQEGDRHALH